jgi:two-component sensor histidine kinase
MSLENQAPETSTPQVPEINVDEILSEINSPEPERLMTNPAGTDSLLGTTPTEATKEILKQPEQTPSILPEFEIEWNGRKIKAPVDKLTKWASQGYDYSQRMEQFRKEQARHNEMIQAYDKYKKVDEYVQKDPQWWSFVEEQWNNRLANEDPTLRRVQAIVEEKLAPVQSLLQQQEEQAKQAQIQQEDSALTQDIKSIRERYSDLDFDTPDVEGKSLELKILEHATSHKFPTFKSAFLDFYHDQLEKRWEARGREALSKDVEKRQKLGLSATKPTPTRAPTDNFDVAGKSYNQILQEINERLGI